MFSYWYESTVVLKIRHMRTQGSQVITENDRVIHLYNTIGDLGSYIATLLNKENKRFSPVYLGTYKNSVITGGPREIY